MQEELVIEIIAREVVTDLVHGIFETTVSSNENKDKVEEETNILIEKKCDENTC